MADNNFWGDWVTPDLSRNPGLANDALNSGQPHVVAPLLSHVARTTAVSDAISENSDTHQNQSFWNQVGGGILTGLEWLGKPLKEVQRDYKFIHSVYADHGLLPGFLATLGVIGGGTLGALTGGAAGAALGADLAAFGTRKLLGSTFQDSYNKSEDENYKVSPGRDFTNLASKATSAIGWKAASEAFKQNRGLGKFASGFGDLAFDLSADPIATVGRFGTIMREAKLLKTGTNELKYPILNTIPGAQEWVQSRALKAISSEQMDALRAGGLANSASRQYNRGLQDIVDVVKKAKEDGEPLRAAGELIQRYPQLGTENVGRIVSERIDTVDKLHNYFKTSMYLGDVRNNIAGQAILPSRTLLRAKLSDTTVADALRNAYEPKFIVDQATGETIANPAYSKFSATQRLSNIYKTFTGYMPYSVDLETLKLSLNKFKWNAPDAATVVYRIGRMGLGDRAAKIFAGKYAEAVALNDQALARSIKNQAMWESLKGLGLPDHDQFVKEAWDAVNNIDVPKVSTQVYEVDHLGNPLGQYATSSGTKIGGLTSKDASDKFDIPNFLEIKKHLRSYGLLKENFDKLDQALKGKASRVLYGHNDEFIVDKYINAIFKPLALGTAGFGLRVSAAEMIPTFARYGIINSAKAKLAVSAAKSNVEVMPAEERDILAATMMGLGVPEGSLDYIAEKGYPAFNTAYSKKMKFAQKLLPEDQLELAQKVILQNRGHFLSDAVSTGQGHDASTAYQARQAATYSYQVNRRNVMLKELKDYTTYTPTDKYYGVMLASNLNKATSNTTFRNIATDLIKNSKTALKDNKFQITMEAGKEAEHSAFQQLREQLTTLEYNRMMNAVAGKFHGYDEEMNTISRWHDAMADGTMREFAQDRVDALLGKVIGRDGTYHKSFSEGIVNKGEFSPSEMIKLAGTQSASMPAGVAGPVLEPYIPSDPFKLNSIVNLGFKKVIDPIINNLSREQLYMLHVGDAYAQLKPMIGKGLLDDQAVRIAQTRASLSMLPQIHNTALRNQFAQLARNFLPFYFAQEQALRRAFKTLKDTSVGSPLFSTGIRYYQLAEHGINNPGFIQTDENGNSYFYFPGAGAFGQALQGGLSALGVPMVSGLPITVRGSMTSLKSVLPELSTPGVAPYLAVSGNIISDLFPSARPYVEGTVGKISMDRAAMDVLIPATWAKSLLAQLSPTDFNHQMSNAIAGALASAYYHNQVPNPDASDMEKQAFIDRIKNNARSLLLMKTFLGLTSPLAPQISQEDTGFRDEFWKLVKTKGNYADAMLEFVGNHGDRAISYTVAKTKSDAFPGGKLPYIQGTVDFIKQNKNLFSGTTPGADGKPQSTSYGAFFLIPQEPQSQSDRNAYNELINMHFRSQRTPEELLKAMYIAQGDEMMYPLIKQHAETLNNIYDPYSKQQENARWKAVMDKMANLYPVWYKDYTSGEGKENARIAYNQLQLIFQNKLAPETEQTKLVAGLMKDYATHKYQMDQYKMMGVSGFAANSEQDNWDNYLVQLAENEPRLKPVITSVFRKLG